MRIVTSDSPERIIRCPECKKLLAYTEGAVENVYDAPSSPTSYSWLKRYIKCPVCSYRQLLSWSEV